VFQKRALSSTLRNTYCINIGLHNVLKIYFTLFIVAKVKTARSTMANDSNNHKMMSVCVVEINASIFTNCTHSSQSVSRCRCVSVSDRVNRCSSRLLSQQCCGRILYYACNSPDRPTLLRSSRGSHSIAYSPTTTEQSASSQHYIMP